MQLPWTHIARAWLHIRSALFVASSIIAWYVSSTVDLALIAGSDVDVLKIIPGAEGSNVYGLANTLAKLKLQKAQEK
jgi:hypothetical protein